MTIPPPLPLVTVFRTMSVPDTAMPVAPPPWNESAPPSDLDKASGFRVYGTGFRD